MLSSEWPPLAAMVFWRYYKAKNWMSIHGGVRARVCPLEGEHVIDLVHLGELAGMSIAYPGDTSPIEEHHVRCGVSSQGTGK